VVLRLLPSALAQFYLLTVLYGFVLEITMRRDEIIRLNSGNILKVAQSLAIVVCSLAGVLTAQHFVMDISDSVKLTWLFLVLLSLFKIYLIIPNDKYPSISSNKDIRTSIQYSALILRVLLLFYWFHFLKDASDDSCLSENVFFWHVKYFLYDSCKGILFIIIFMGGYELASRMVAMYIMFIDTYPKGDNSTENGEADGQQKRDQE